MSSHRNKRRRANERNRNTSAVPMLVERVQMQEQTHGLTYEEAKWARLSPAFRAAHNRLRQARGMPTIPPPKIDLYVAPQQPRIDKIDPLSPEAQAAARQFLRPEFMLPGEQGFTINGVRARW